MNVAALLAQLQLRPLHIGTLTLSLEYRRCGHHCNGCPHGPYVYARERNGRRKYISSAARLTDHDLRILLSASAIDIP